jgi:zinc protease
MRILLVITAASCLLLSNCTPKTTAAVQTSTQTTDAPPMAPPTASDGTVTAMPTPPAPPSPPALPMRVPMDPRVRIGKMANGMSYYIMQNDKPDHRAELRLAVKAGSMQEDDDQQGLAHFIEHMAFNGTTNFSKNELVDYLERMGSRFGPDLNAYTSFDETVYMLQVRTDEQAQFDKGLLILRDWASGISFDSAEIDKERGVVISEWRTGLSASQRMEQQYLPFLYFNSRYAQRLPIGKPDIVNTASYDVIKRYYRDWYRPELMAVFVVGNVDLDATEQQIKTMFGDFTTRTLGRSKVTNAVPNHQQTFVRIITDHEATNANIQIYNKHAFEKVIDEEDFRERITHTLYNRMLGRRLADLAKTSNPPFINGFTGYSQDVGDLALYRSFASAESKDVRRAINALLDENQRVLDHGFTAGELEREKAAIMKFAEQNLLEESKMESGRMVQRLISHFLDEAPFPNAQQTMDMYRSMMPGIQVSELNALAKKWIADQNRVVIITAAEKDRAMLPDSAEVISMLSASKYKKLEPYSDVDLSAPILSGDFPVQPVSSKTHDAALDVYTWKFANGIEVRAKPTAYKNDEIIMVAYSPGGHSIYPDSKYPSARSASFVIANSGVGTYNATALEKKLSGLRVNVVPSVSERFEGFNATSSVQDLRTMMQLVYSYATRFREDTVALNAYLKRERATYGSLFQNPMNWYSDKVTRISSQNHPRRGFPTLELYDKVNLPEIMSIYRDRFSDLSDMTFMFVGNFNVDTLEKVTSQYLGALPGAGRKETYKDVGDRYPAGKVDSIYYRGEAPRTMVQMIFHGTDHFNPDTSYLLQSLVDVARIKLRESLREDEGGVYGVSISGAQQKFPLEQYSIRISFNVDPLRADELIESCMEVLRKLKTDIDPADIVKITEAQRQGRIKDRETNQFWMGAMINTYVNEVDMKQHVELESLEKRIASLHPEVIKQAARKYFNEGELIRIIMHPEKK